MKKTLLITLFALLGITQAAAQDDLTLPYLSEGVRFVNEKVIVENGDTTQHYYNYEMAPGIYNYMNADGIIEHIDVIFCHYFIGSSFDELNDSIISGVQPTTLGYFTTFDNLAQDEVVAEGRNLVIPNGLITEVFLYDGLYSYYNFWGWTIDHYTRPNLQVEVPGLQVENFVEIEPVDIDGQQMQRIAYVDNQGDTLAYIVQGIGFDSRDMGDLLTPFTRKPDPDADHQEWCGLSHVIKDGKVIYKGLRWREETMTGIDEVVAEPTRRPLDDNYYNLMGQPVGKEVPTTPGIYIHHGQKICVSRMR
jgi:hypothetical protein